MHPKGGDNMKQFLRILSAVVMLGTAVATFAAGLRAGDRCSAFNVNDITGANKGKTLCYI